MPWPEPEPEAALWQAAHQGDLLWVTRLLRANADPNGPAGPAPKRTRPLHEAARADSAELVVALLAAGARTDVVDADRNTPLHTCCAYSASVEVVRALVRANIEVGARNVDGVTPLHLAVKAAAKETVRVLVGAGADPLLSDYQGLDALGYSRDDSMDQLLTQLIKATTDDVDGRLLPGAGRAILEGARPDLTGAEAMRQAIMKAVLPEGLDQIDATHEEFEKARALADRIRTAFGKLDVDESGGVSRRELKRALEEEKGKKEGRSG
ncbi:ankyrin repeat-containing domain protein [Pavlovales sp. CCMP2436]|nr:ankyrin repeat-containing domain protein [Pavlovales sp. CCMP2436]